MEKRRIQSWFGSLSPSEKTLVLLRTMYELTLVVRGVFVHYQDNDTRWRLAFSVSELNHRLTSAATAIMQGEETYPDDTLVEMLFEQPAHPELEPYFPYVLERAVQYVKDVGLSS